MERVVSNFNLDYSIKVRKDFLDYGVPKCFELKASWEVQGLSPPFFDKDSFDLGLEGQKVEAGCLVSWEVDCSVS